MTTAAAFFTNIATSGMGRAFRHRDFTLFALSGWLANSGMWLQRIGVQWLTWEITGSYGWLGAMAGIGGPVGSFSLGGLVTAVIGALVILAVFRPVSK